MRLVSYWVSHTGRLLHSLDAEAKLACEAVHGPGDQRKGQTHGLPVEARILAAAVACASPRRRGSRQVREPRSEQAPDSDRQDPAEHAVPTAHRHRPMAANAAVNILSDREKEVLHWISLGASNKGVAQKLSISVSTVRTHVESVFRKLGCTTRAAATLKAVQLGLLDPPDPPGGTSLPD